MQTNPAWSLRLPVQDPHNPELRAHVLRGDIGPEAFVQMTATDLASKASQLTANLAAWPVLLPVASRLPGRRRWTSMQNRRLF